MRIFADELNRTLDKATLLLTRQEARDLQSAVEQLLREPDGFHVHVDGEGFLQGVALATYGDEVPQAFSERFARVIRDNE